MLMNKPTSFSNPRDLYNFLMEDLKDFIPWAEWHHRYFLRGSESSPPITSWWMFSYDGWVRAGRPSADMAMRDSLPDIEQCIEWQVELLRIEARGSHQSQLDDLLAERDLARAAIKRLEEVEMNQITR